MRVKSTTKGLLRLPSSRTLVSLLCKLVCVVPIFFACILSIFSFTSLLTVVNLFEWCLLVLVTTLHVENGQKYWSRQFFLCWHLTCNKRLKYGCTTALHLVCSLSSSAIIYKTMGKITIKVSSQKMYAHDMAHTKTQILAACLLRTITTSLFGIIFPCTKVLLLRKTKERIPN